MPELKSRRHAASNDLWRALRDVAESLTLITFDSAYRLGLKARRTGEPARSIAIVVRRMTDGIARDCVILSERLERMGYVVSIHEKDTRSHLDLILRRRIADVILHLESIHRVWLNAGVHNLVVPNQEWIYRDNARYFRYADHVFCKTHHAENLFKEPGIPSSYIGFSTPDRRFKPTGRPSDEDRFLHVAGKSTLKGTSSLIEVWKKHPEWPELIVCTRLPNHHEGVEAGNITFMTGFLEEEKLKALQNRIGNHVCTSTSEGFGHYIMEALSIGAVTLFTNAPPMNDLVGWGNGIPVDIADARPRGQGMDFFIDADDLERKIEHVIFLSPEQRDTLSANARQRYETICADFEERFPATFRAELSSEDKQEL